MFVSSFQSKNVVKNFKQQDEYYAETHNVMLRKLYESIDYTRLFTVRYLLDHAAIDLSSKKGRRALSITCRIPDSKEKSRKIILDWLIQQGCDYNFLDEDGLTLLSWLCKHNKMDLVKFLVKKYEMELKYDSTDTNKDCALMHAVRTGNLSMVKILLKVMIKFTIDIDIRNSQDITPYGEAIQMNFINIAELLKMMGKASTNISIKPFWMLNKTTNCVTSFKDVIQTTVSRVNNKSVLKKIDKEEAITTNERDRTASAEIKSKIYHYDDSKILPLFSRFIFEGYDENEIKDSLAQFKSPEQIIELYSSKRRISSQKIPASSLLKNAVDQSGNVSSIKKHSTSKRNKRKKSLVSTRDVSRTSSRKSSAVSIDNEIDINSDGQNTTENKAIIRPCLLPHVIKAFSDTVTEQRVTTRPSSTLPPAPVRRISVRTPRSISRKVSNISNSAISTKDPDDRRVEFDDKVLDLQTRMDNLMEYKSEQFNKYLRINYTDLKQYYQSNEVIGSATSPLRNLRWLMAMKAEQKRIQKQDIINKNVNITVNNSDFRHQPPKLPKRKMASVSAPVITTPIITSTVLVSPCETVNNNTSHLPQSSHSQELLIPC